MSPNIQIRFLSVISITNVTQILFYVTASQTFLPVDPFWFLKITTGTQIFAHVYAQCPDDRCPKSNIYISTPTLYKYGNIPVAHITTYFMILP